MMSSLNEIITNRLDLSAGYTIRDGFVFTSTTDPTNIFDSLVIRNPLTANVMSPMLGISPRSLEDHINLINFHALKKAVVIATSLDFLSLCPSLEYLEIHPVHQAGVLFDNTPIYNLPNLKGLHFVTQDIWGKEQGTPVDYRQLTHLKEAIIVGKKHLGYEEIGTLQKLSLGYQNQRDLINVCSKGSLLDLDIDHCKIESLDGIDKAYSLRSLTLSHNQRLGDISQLERLSSSLEELTIDTCSQITDFSPLASLTQLKHLVLCGTNKLPSLLFLNSMPNLATFVLTMTVVDGDIRPCLRIPYVHIANRRHYNLKNNMLSKKVMVKQ